MTRTPFIAGNWKLHKTVGEAVALVKALREKLDGIEGVDVAVAPTYTALAKVADALEGSTLNLAAQNMYFEDQGAFTGEISAPLLLDAGCKYVIIGHSERRNVFGESSELVNKKVHAALKHGLNPIVCVGELLEQRKAGETLKVIEDQINQSLADVSKDGIEKVTIAYEPVWAIGTGETATPEQAQEVHEQIRGQIKSKYDDTVAAGIRIQYGGSAKPGNAADLMTMQDIDGLLVGGASLKAGDFIAIAEAARGK